ncbi:MAG: hypothetical protein AAFQ94_30210 [Bacteroidota bacterium]
MLKEKLLYSSLYVLIDTDQIGIIDGIEVALGIKLVHSSRDEDGNEYWSGKLLGFEFLVSYSANTPKVYCISVNSMVKSPKPEKLNIDFHFKDMLLKSGFKSVMTSTEYGEYLDNIGVK